MPDENNESQDSEESELPAATIIAAEILNLPPRDRLLELMLALKIALDELLTQVPESDFEAKEVKDQTLVLTALVMLLKMSIKDFPATIPAILVLTSQARSFQNEKDVENEKIKGLLEDYNTESSEENE